MPLGASTDTSKFAAAVSRKQTVKFAPVRTYAPKASEITREWWVIDAEGMVLGRLATEVARILRGKHKAMFAPHLDCGAHAIVVNADKVVLTSGKAEKKKVWRHSGFPCAITSMSYREVPELRRAARWNREGQYA